MTTRETTDRQNLPVCREILPGLRDDLMKALRIKQWFDKHETHESRKYKHLHWVAMPTKQDGIGFRHAVSQPNASDLLSAWYLMCQVAARGQPGQRGWLVRNGKPLGAMELKLMTGLRQEAFAAALEFFQNEPADWLEWGEIPAESPGAPAESPGAPAESPGAPAESGCYSTVQYSTQVQKREREGTGGGRKLADVAASRTQAGAILVRIKGLEGRQNDLTPEERAELRKNRAALAALQKKQAAGDFSPVQAFGAGAENQQPTKRKET